MTYRFPANELFNNTSTWFIELEFHNNYTKNPWFWVDLSKGLGTSSGTKQDIYFPLIEKLFDDISRGLVYSFAVDEEFTTIKYQVGSYEHEYSLGTLQRTSSKLVI